MKLKAFFLVIALSFLINSIEGTEKYYLQPGALFMNEEGLFADVEGILYPVISVKRDEQGVYVEEWEYKWKCQECKKPNPIWFSFCAWCGKPQKK